MKTNDKKALFGKTSEELEKMVTDLSKKIAANKMDLFIGKLKNPRVLSVMRDDIARAKTALRMHTLEKGAK